MEKYSRWRDHGTGIHPFLPHQFKPRSVGARLISWLVGAVLIVVRLPFIALLFPILFALDKFVALLPIGLLQRLLRRTLIALIARLLLLFMGFWWIKSGYQPLQFKKTNSKTSSIASGDLVIANKTSYVETLYFAYALTTVYAVPQNYWTENDEEKPSQVVILQSWYEAFLNYISDARLKKSAPATSLNDALKTAANSHSSPLIISPEGVTTNGQGMLELLPVFNEIALPKERIHLVVFKYDFEHFSPCFPVGKFASHFFGLISQVSNTIQVRWLPEEESPVLDSKTSNQEGREQIGKYLAALARVRSTKLTSLDKHDFLDYWNETQQRDYVKSK
eukprot:TRINITY_DN875_c0_g1_i2.p1 TRINITY_DN875_c0_g1~~TRINITY_DN875_c0_g1_i2.p1  ORF type:complete len:335 (+),score=54.16 TRINITY_DN875_c0_g1_i2:886-1890(+)